MISTLTFCLLGFTMIGNAVDAGDGLRFVDSGQTLGDGMSFSVALGDLDGDGDLDAWVAKDKANAVWRNDGTGTFTDSGQALGNSMSLSVALGTLDGDTTLDAWVANGWAVTSAPQSDEVWTNTVTDTGVCCAPSGCMLMTENLSGFCEGLGGIYLPDGSCDECPTPCPSDLNGDGVVDGQDLAMVLAAWGLPCDD